MAVTILRMGRPLLMTSSNYTHKDSSKRAQKAELPLYTNEELLSLLDRSEEDIKTGRTYTMNQVREMFHDRYGV